MIFKDPAFPIKEQSISENESFKRMMNNLVTYQEFLQQANNEEEKQQIRTRMKKIFTRKPPKEPMTDADKLNLAFDQVVQEALTWCETEEFSSERFAELIQENGLTEQLLKKFSPQSGETVDGGAVMLNDFISYHFEAEDVASIHIMAANIPSEKIYEKLFEGLTLLVEKLKDDLPQIKTITMKSWLLSQEFIPKIKKIFGDNVEIETLTEEDDSVVIPVEQRIPLRFNSKALRKYLTTGEKPSIGTLTLTVDQFIEAVEKLK